MSLGLEGAYGVAGGWDALHKIIAERKKDEILKYKQEEDRRQYELQLRQQQDSEKWRELQFETLQNEREKAQAERDRSNLEQEATSIKESHAIGDFLMPQESRTLTRTGNQAVQQTPTTEQAASGLGSLGAVPGMTPTLSAMLKTYGGTAQQQHQATADELAAQARTDAEARDARNATQQDRMYDLAVRNSNKASFAFPTINIGGVPTIVKVDRRTGQLSAVPVGEAAIPPAQQTQLLEAGSSNYTLGKMKELYNPDYVGPVMGRRNQIGLTTGKTLSNEPIAPELAQFGFQIAANKNRVIRMITGAASAVQEQARIMKQVADWDQPPAVFEANMNGQADLERNLMQRIITRQLQGLPTPGFGPGGVDLGGAGGGGAAPGGAPPGGGGKTHTTAGGRTYTVEP